MSELPQTVTEEFPDLRIKDYTITNVIGEGGQAVVLQLEKDGILYTGKVVHRNWSLTPWIEDLKGLRRGVEISQALDHPSIQKVTEVIDEKEKKRFIVVKPYAQGRSLREMIDADKTIPKDKLVDILDKTLDALAYLHDPAQHPSVQAVYHRDIKPEHIIVADDGQITLIDMDTAKPSGGKTTQYTAAGTRIYAAPESLLGTNDARSDLYSLGFVAVEALLGEVPEELSDSRLYGKKGYSLPEYVPEKLRAVVNKMVLAEPEERWQRAVDVQMALGTCLEETGNIEKKIIMALPHSKELAVVDTDALRILKERYEILKGTHNFTRKLTRVTQTAIGALGIYSAYKWGLGDPTFLVALGIIPVSEVFHYFEVYKTRKETREVQKRIMDLEGRVSPLGFFTRILRMLNKMEGWEGPRDPGYEKIAGIALNNNNVGFYIETVEAAVHSLNKETRVLAEEMLRVYERDQDFSNSYPCIIGLTKVPGYSQLKRAQERIRALEALCEKGDIEPWALSLEDLHTIAQYDPSSQVQALAEDMYQSYEVSPDFSRTQPFIRKVIAEYATTLFSIAVTKSDEHMHVAIRDRYKTYIVDRALAPATTFADYQSEAGEHERARTEFLQAFPNHPVYLEAIARHAEIQKGAEKVGRAYASRLTKNLIKMAGGESPSLGKYIPTEKYDVERVIPEVIMKQKYISNLEGILKEPTQLDNIASKDEYLKNRTYDKN